MCVDSSNTNRDGRQRGLEQRHRIDLRFELSHVTLEPRRRSVMSRWYKSLLQEAILSWTNPSSHALKVINRVAALPWKKHPSELEARIFSAAFFIATCSLSWGAHIKAMLPPVFLKTSPVFCYNLHNCVASLQLTSWPFRNTFAAFVDGKTV